MDYQNYQNHSNFMPPRDRRSHVMEAAALGLSIFAIISCAWITPAIICSALAMVLATLSRGGEYQMGTKGTVAFYLSLATLIIITLLTISSLALCCYLFGGWDNMFKTFDTMRDMSFSESYKFLNDILSQKLNMAY